MKRAGKTGSNFETCGKTSGRTRRELSEWGGAQGHGTKAAQTQRTAGPYWSLTRCSTASSRASPGTAISRFSTGHPSTPVPGHTVSARVCQYQHILAHAHTALLVPD
eukprot:328013-Rhodomonas_salina.2